MVINFDSLPPLTYLSLSKNDLIQFSWNKRFSSSFYSKPAYVKSFKSYFQNHGTKSQKIMKRPVSVEWFPTKNIDYRVCFRPVRAEKPWALQTVNLIPYS